MKRTGTAVAEVPVYSRSDAIDFVYHWLRISWPELLIGRLIDKSNETCGQYLCRVLSIGYPIPQATTQARDRAIVEIETNVTALARSPDEESSSNPESAFAVSEVAMTLGIRFELVSDSNRFRVAQAQLRPYSAKGKGLVDRYGGRTVPYVWTPDSQPSS